MPNLVEIRDLRIEATSDAGNKLQIIKGVDLDIAAGEIVALIGESGSGKTTIALSLMGHTRRGCAITGGAIRLDGRDVVGMTERQRAALRGAAVYGRALDAGRGRPDALAGRGPGGRPFPHRQAAAARRRRPRRREADADPPLEAALL
jgi:energy-coupling factor transporter ATP-binding protein EcfA2